MEQGGALVDLGSAQSRKDQRKLSWADVATVFKYRKLWGVYLGQFAVTSCQWFFLTWFPTYLIEFRHLSFVKSGLYASIPFLAAFLGVLCSGWASDRILRSGRSLGAAEVESILTEQGQVEVGCDFCGAQYRFDPVDAAQLFTGAAASSSGSGEALH